MISSITPTILVQLLRPYGYEVTQRCLTDWRFKGYLPPMARISRGYRKGVLRCWTQTNLLKLALDVCRRLRERQSKRNFGPEFRNWINGAEIPVCRAKKSWLKELQRTAHMPKSEVRRCATEWSKFLPLNSDVIRETLEEILCVLFCPKYRAGEKLDISFIRRLAQCAVRRLPFPGNPAVVDEKILIKFLRYVNAYFSPAGVWRMVDSATSHELLEARNAWLGWWRRLDQVWQLPIGGMAPKSSLMSLAGLLAPIGVLLLLPTHSLDAVENLAGAI